MEQTKNPGSAHASHSEQELNINDHEDGLTPADEATQTTNEDSRQQAPQEWDANDETTSKTTYAPQNNKIGSQANKQQNLPPDGKQHKKRK